MGRQCSHYLFDVNWLLYTDLPDHFTGAGGLSAGGGGGAGGWRRLRCLRGGAGSGVPSLREQVETIARRYVVCREVGSARLESALGSKGDGVGGPQRWGRSRRHSCCVRLTGGAGSYFGVGVAQTRASPRRRIPPQTHLMASQRGRGLQGCLGRRPCCQRCL